MSNDNDTPQVPQNDAVDNSDLPKVDEMATLKARADMLGVTYHPSIGLEKLREKVMVALTQEVKPEQQDEPVDEVPAYEEVAEETSIQRRERKRREANELVRINVSCMNPAKKEWEGEIFTVGNSVVGSFTKFVPFNTEDGWHVPRIIYNVIKERKCQIFKTVQRNGNSVREGQLIKEFNVMLLDNLTPEELKDLAQRQAMSKAID